MIALARLALAAALIVASGWLARLARRPGALDNRCLSGGAAHTCIPLDHVVSAKRDAGGGLNGGRLEIFDINPL
jgi:hypothetical protein